MKKVGLATCFIDNYGACLQAYALQKKIKDLGFDCKILNYTQPDGYHNENLRSRVVYSPILLPVFSLMKKDFRNTHESIIKFNQFRKKYLKFTKHLPTTESVYKADLDFDAYVCGSDQIWNPLLFNGNEPIYFLDFAKENQKKIAYAASIGVSDFPEECKQDFKQLLSGFDYIGVREIEGKNIVEQVAGVPADVVLDPTLLLDKQDWGKIANNPKISEPYIFCYLFGERPYIGEFVDYVKKITGYKVVCIPFTDRERNSDNLNITTAGPLEFLGLIKNAELVITDSFHATAFSINFNTPFYSLLRNSDNEKNNMNSRIYSILELSGLIDRMVTPDIKYPFSISTDIDFASANLFLDEKRKSDLNELKHHLGDI